MNSVITQRPLRTPKNTSQKWYLIEDYSSNESEKKKLYSSATYTEKGDYLKTQTDQAGNTTTYNYDTVNGTLSSVTNAAGNTTTYSYNPKNNDLLSVSADGHTNTYSYNNDRLTEINVNNSTHYKFNYDKFGRTVTTTVGNGTNSVILSALEYDQKGLMTKQTYGNKDYISFAYDSLDRLSEKSYNKEDGSSVAKKQYIYGNDGNISVTVDFASNSYTRYNYDLSGRTASVREYSGTDVSSNIPISYTEYKYADKTNYLTNVKHFSPIGTQNIAYKYGNVNNGEMPDQVYSVSWNGVEKVTNKFDSLSRLTKRTVNGLATNYTYKDLEGNQTTTLVKSIETVGITHTYEYDSLGNITSIYDGSKTTTYKYDALNQLVRADNPYENKTHIYTYENGNITEDKVYEYTTGNLPEYPESKTQYLYENATWSDILTGVKKSHFDNGVEIIDDRYSISSDTIGNITNLNGSEYSWLGRQLQSVSNSDNSNTTYSYNADGQRIAKVVNSANGDEYNYVYYYNGDILAGYKLVITKSDGSSTTHNVAFMYDENGEAFGFSINGKEYFYVKNAQNDVIAIVNSNNETVATYRYNSWGKLISCEDTSENQEVSFLNPYTYRNYYYDSDTEMYFLKSRYYNPELHRFINADGLINANQDVLGYNLFAYCSNDPINCSDTTGCGKIKNWIKNVAKTVFTYLYDPLTALDTAFTGASDSIKTLSASLLKESKIGKYRPKNIGRGTYKKGLIKQSKTVSKFSKALSLVSIVTLSAEVGQGIYSNIKQGSGAKKTIIDATVDLSISGSSMMISGAIGAGVGALVGSSFPVVGNIVIEVNNDNTFIVNMLYNEDGEALGVNCHSELEGVNKSLTFLFVKDAQGNVVSISALEGGYFFNLSYDSFGNPSLEVTGSEVDKIQQSIADAKTQLEKILLQISGALGIALVTGITFMCVPTTYRGYMYDMETGLYYCQSRYYSPEWGRFINADDTSLLELTTGNIHGANLFAYCNNDPVNNTDPSGYWARTVIACVSGAVFGGIAYAIGRAFGISGWKLAAFTSAFVAAGITIGAIWGPKILYKINALIKPVIYFFSNPGKVYLGVKFLSKIQFELHNPHHGKSVHFVIRMSQGGRWKQILEWVFKK